MKQECIPVGYVPFAATTITDGIKGGPLSKVFIKLVSPGRTVGQDVLHRLDQQNFPEHL